MSRDRQRTKTKGLQSETRDRKYMYMAEKHSYCDGKESRLHSSALAKFTRLLTGAPSLFVHPSLRWFRKANLAHRRFRALSELEERKDTALHRLRGQ